TLQANHLREVETVLESHAVLIRTPLELPPAKDEWVQRLLMRIDGVQQVSESKYIILHAPRAALPEIHKLLPGSESPTIIPLEGVQLEALAVPRIEFIQARRSLAARQIAALECAIANVHEFHSAHVMQPLALETMPGVRCERIIRPISAVGLYVPAGSAPLPSTVVMLAVPARIAGCARRILCTAPTPQGHANPAVLVAAELCGVESVFKVGGAQAIAALAYGTASVPKVDKIFGPGNAWVTAAKQLVANDPAGAACDLPAGPSEVLV